ncbi:MAG TPA: hypothetical protein QF564_22450 [Pirellulaceae bacterium]|nr:hypothetical protein [Pirellulaceae bacterium]
MAKSRFLSVPQIRLLVIAHGFLAMALVFALVSSRCAADDEQLSEIERLSLDQSRIADNYARLEQTIIRMAEIEASTNPQRAALLKRAVQQSSERLTRMQLNAAVKLLAPPAKLKRAIDDQEQALKDLKDLLKLLLSEDRSERRKDQRDQVREFIKEVVRLIRLQRGLEGRTQNADDPKKLAGDQERVAERTGGLAKRIKESEEGEPKDGEPKDGEPKDGEPKDGEPKDGEPKDGEPKDGEPKDGEPKDGEPKDGEPKDGEPKDGEPKDGEPKDGEPKDGEPKDGEPKDGEPKDGEPKDGEPKDGEPKDGEPKDGEPKDGEDASGQGDSPPPPESENPARKRIQAAEERMRKAQQKLEEAKRDDAVKAQEEARRELEKAKEELEEILRQLREEEVEHALAMLEGRFRRMLESQLKIYESTKRLEKIAADDRGRQVDIQASKLGFDESKLAVDADKALLVLVEEGSSVAFPETVQQMRDEMRSVADRLAAVKVGLITQTAEEEIIAALEDMITALQQAQQDMEEKKQSQPPQQSTPINPEDMPLVDQIAELKMIRGLQIRINTRTKRYARLLVDIDDPVGATTDGDLRRELSKLAERQERIYRVTRDIEIGKNRQ